MYLFIIIRYIFSQPLLSIDSVKNLHVLMLMWLEKKELTYGTQVTTWSNEGSLTIYSAI